MTSYDIQVYLIPTIFRFLIHVFVGGPFLVIVAYFHHSWQFKINADISILDKSVILGLPCCVFAGYIVLTYANDSLTHCLPDRIKTIRFGKRFHDCVYYTVIWSAAVRYLIYLARECRYCAKRKLVIRGDHFKS